MPTWKTLDTPEVIKHNPNCVLVGMYIHQPGEYSLRGCVVHAVYAVEHDGTNEGLELYFIPTHRSGTSIDASRHFYYSRRYLTHEIPKKWKQVFEQLKAVAKEVKS